MLSWMHTWARSDPEEGVTYPGERVTQGVQKGVVKVHFFKFFCEKGHFETNLYF